MKNTLWIYLAMLTVVSVLTGCGKQREVVVVAKKSQISGQVFVATQGGDSRKLGDIPIALYDEETILNFQTNVISYLQKTQSDFAKFNSLIAADEQSIAADKQSILADEKSIVADEKSIIESHEVVAKKLDAIEKAYTQSMGQLLEKWKTLEIYRAQKTRNLPGITSLDNAKSDTTGLIGYAWPKDNILIPDKTPVRFKHVTVGDIYPLVKTINASDLGVSKPSPKVANSEADFPKRHTAIGTPSSVHETQNWFIEMARRESSQPEGYLVICRGVEGSQKIGLLPFFDRLGNPTGMQLGQNTIAMSSDVVELKPGYFPFQAMQKYPVLSRGNQNLKILFLFQTFTQAVSVAEADVRFVAIADYNKAIEAMTQDLKFKADKALEDGRFWAVRDIFMAYSGDFAQGSVEVREKLANEYEEAIEKQARMADKAFQDEKDNLWASSRNQRDAENQKRDEFDELIKKEINAVHARIDTAKAHIQDSAERIDQLQKTRDGLTVSDLRNLISVYLGPPFKTTRTDADGQFSFEVVEPKRYALLTLGERAIMNSTEHYLWLAWVEPKNGEYSRALLSGNNLLRGYAPQSLLSLETVK